MTRRTLIAGLLAQPRLNILWIVGDDLGTEVGCYGHPLARTPNLDRLAAEGARFENCHTTSPVCSPSRSAYQTGLYQTATGVHGHRSHRRDGYRLPAPARLISHRLREAGYRVFNNGKTDFNFTADKPFDGVEPNPGDRPFFWEVNIVAPHKGPAWKEAPRVTDRGAVDLPPYFPDDPVVREEVAGYLDAVQLFDVRLGELLKRVPENTVVFVFGDNGRCLLRGKQWLYEPGTHVPLIVRWPDRRLAGTVRRDLCTLLDMNASTLGVAGVPVPKGYHGADLFARGHKPRPHIFTARDRCGIAVDRIRAVRDTRYRFIRNFMPERPRSQPNAYIDVQYPTLAVLQRWHAMGKLNPVQAEFLAARKPERELYDLRADPHEIHNLADREPALVKRYEAILDNWLRETGDRGALPEDPSELEQAQEEAARSAGR